MRMRERLALLLVLVGFVLALIGGYIEDTTPFCSYAARRMYLCTSTTSLDRLHTIAFVLAVLGILCISSTLFVFPTPEHSDEIPPAAD